MIDIHSHILTGLDDGPKSIEESLAMLFQGAQAGIKVVFATPHLYFYDRAKPTCLRASRKLAELSQKAQENQIDVRILLGFEIFLQPDLPWLEDLQSLTLGQTGEYLLVELAIGQIPNFVEKTCFDLLLNGVTPILAHPERNLISSSQLSVIERLVNQGVRLQIEAASLVGLSGKELKRASQLLLQKDLVSYLASDAHSQERGFEPLQEAYWQVQKQFGHQKARQLFLENQEKILSSRKVQTHLRFMENQI